MNQSQQLKTVHAGHVDVRNKTIDLIETSTVDQLCAGAEETHRIVRRLQQIFKRAQNTLIIIDDSNSVAGRLMSYRILAERRWCLLSIVGD